MTQIDELVKRLRAEDVRHYQISDDCDPYETAHVNRAPPKIQLEAADALESQSAELACLRERNAELERERVDFLEGMNELDAVYGVLGTADAEGAEPAAHTIDCLMTDLAASKARISSLEATVRETREALTTMRDAVQQWCDAVDRDSSWDGWYHHFKAVKWELLPATNAALAASESVVKSDGEDNGRD